MKKKGKKNQDAWQDERLYFESGMDLFTLECLD